MKNSNFQIFPENINNKDAIDKLYDDVFGKDRKKRSVYNLRTGKKVSDLCFVIKKDGDDIYACIRFWLIRLGLQDGLLLGPLAVRNDLRGHGLGSKLINYSLKCAKLKKLYVTS